MAPFLRSSFPPPSLSLPILRAVTVQMERVLSRMDEVIRVTDAAGGKRLFQGQIALKRVAK